MANGKFVRNRSSYCTAVRSFCIFPKCSVIKEKYGGISGKGPRLGYLLRSNYSADERKKLLYN